MKKTFYLIRHGEKVQGKGDPSLSEVGHLQAKLAAQHFKQFPITKIITSPLLRTRQTAEYIGKELHVPVEVSESLRERANWGDDKNQQFEEFAEMWQKATEERDWQPPVGDSSLKAGQRVQNLIKELSDQDHEHILLVTHGGITKDFLRNVFQMEDLDGQVKEASITIVEMDTETNTFALKQFANTDHLKI